MWGKSKHKSLRDKVIEQYGTIDDGIKYMIDAMIEAGSDEQDVYRQIYILLCGGQIKLVRDEDGDLMLITEYDTGET